MSRLRADPHVGLLLAHSDREADGIRDYACALAGALGDQGVRASIHHWRDGRLDDSVGSVDALVVQYNPFSFGRRGFAPRLPLALGAFRRRPGRPLVGLMCHETYVDMKNVRWALMGGWQRLQLVALQRVSDVQFGTVEGWTARLRRTAGGRPVHHLPVASNLPDTRGERAAGRAEIGAGDDTIVISVLGMRHPGRLDEHVIRGALEAGLLAPQVIVLNLGTGERTTTELAPNVELRSTGFVPEPDLARRIAASDLFLAPYADGVSTRRTTVMAALQHGVAVVGTEGHLTDAILRGSDAVALAPVGDLGRFAGLVGGLAGDPARRTELARRGRELYETEFDWPVLVDRLLSGLDV